MKSLQEFVYRGISAKHLVRDLQSSGALRAPAVSAEERREHDLFAPISERTRAASIEMQRQYRVLYAFENLLRDFVSQRLTEQDGDDWFDKRASAGMKKKVDERKQKEESNKWHKGRNEQPIFYLDFGDLGLLIINHWDSFKDFLPDQAWVTSRVQEAERTRNVIAHTNLLHAEEGDRLEMYLRDWIRQVA